MQINRRVLWMLFLAGTLRAQEFATCPATIRVEPQKLASLVTGWSVVAKAEEPHQLASITFFDGDPKEDASLAPDRSTKLQQSWAFGSSDHSIWLTCRYTGTTVVLGRALPKQVKSCTVTYEANVSIDGMPAIQKLTCR